MSKHDEPWFQPHLEAQITRIWQWSPARKAAKRRAQVSKLPESFRCELCGKEPLTKGMYEVDHIIPKESLGPWDGWGAFIERALGVGAEGLQVICKKPCHSTKSARENAIRRKARKASSNG